MEHAMPQPSRPEGWPSRRWSPRAGSGLDEAPVQLDLLRADLYRLLDELVRARSEYHEGLVLEFERAWEHFKEATAMPERS